ncbi:MAG: hypothetical protein FWH14_04715 [Oscillospiraceae bacterium]|nr:hypothetical protein [Oscillospiraceae bacterium]
MKIFSRLTAFVISIVMVFTLASCSDTTWTFKQDDMIITSGMYLRILMGAFVEAVDKAEDGEQPVLSQEIDGIKADEWIKNRAKELVEQYIATLRHFDELELTLSETDMDSVNYLTDQEWGRYEETDARGNPKNFYLDNGISKATLKEYYIYIKKRDLIFERYYETDGIQEVTQEELKGYFHDEFMEIEFGHFPLFDTMTGQAFEPEEKEELRQKVSGYVDRINAGEPIWEVAHEYYTELQEAMEALYGSDELGIDDHVHSEECDHEDEEDQEDEAPESSRFIVKKDDTMFLQQFSQELMDAVKQTPVNSAVFFDNSEDEADASFIIIYRYDISLNEQNYEDYRQTALRFYKEDDFDKILDDILQNLNILSNPPSIRKHRPSKLTLNQ